MNDEILEKLKPIIDLNKEINKFDYGIKGPGGEFIQNPTEKEFNEYYKTIPTTEFLRIKGGTCWEYARFYYDKLASLGYPTDAYFSFKTCTDSDFETHTFTISHVDDLVVYVESAWKSHMGVYISNNNTKLLDAFIKDWVRNKNHQVATYRLSKLPAFPRVGLNCDKTMNYYMGLSSMKEGKVRTDYKPQFEHVIGKLFVTDKKILGD